jgi:hypothetical protein
VRETNPRERKEGEVRLWTREEDEEEGGSESRRPHLAGAIVVGKPPLSGRFLVDDEASGTLLLRVLAGGCRTGGRHCRAPCPGSAVGGSRSPRRGSLPLRMPPTAADGI